VQIREIRGQKNKNMNILYKEEAYLIIGKCMEVHNALGHGFLEIVYKDALELIFRQNGIAYEREKMYAIHFRNTILPHRYQADFVIMNKIILEVKSVSALTNEHIAQTLNYLKVSNNALALLVNFGKPNLESKRLIL